MSSKPLALSLPPWTAVLLFVTSAASGITVTDLQHKLTVGEKVTVIDVRVPELFARGHVPGAINVPASLCAQKKLPPLGKVIVCGDGLGHDATDKAAADLAINPGLTSVDVLEGGFSAWESAHLASSKSRGMQPEVPNYITYAELKAAAADDVVLIDLRDQPKPVRQSSTANADSAANPLTDLSQAFPGMAVTKSAFDLPQSRQSVVGTSSTPPLIVLIDNGDGKAQTMARKLKANGIKRYVILAGGEMILKRNGQAGLQRNGIGSSSLRQSATNNITTH